MNANHDDDGRLDALLGHWSEQTAVPTRLDDLQQRIVQSASEPEHSAPKLNGHARDLIAPHCRGTRQRNAWASGFAVGAVATLLIGIGVWFLALAERDTGGTDLTPDYAWLLDEQVQNKQRLLSEMDAMFDGQLAWLAETGDRVEFGLVQGRGNEGGVSATHENNHLAVRVVIERRQSTGDDWQVAWALDVVSRNEEFVCVAPRDSEGKELKLWTYRLPNGLIAIDSEVDLAGHDGLHATTSGVQEDREPVKVFTSNDNGTEYRVFQTVAVLDGGLS